MPKPKLLMLITNLTFGGAQRVFYDHSKLLSEDYDVSELVFNLEDPPAFVTGNPLLSLDVGGGGGRLAKVANAARRVVRLGRIRRDLRPAVTISHLEGADYVNILARGGGKRLLCVHGSKLHDANIRGALGALRLRLLVPYLYNRADRIVTVSHEIAEELVALGVRRSLIRPIHNFFDPPAIDQRSRAALSPQEEAIFAGPPVLVTSGRLTLQKNQAPLIDLFAQLLQRRPARLLLLGDGELNAALVTRARNLGLRVHVGPEPSGEDCDIYFLGFQDNPFRLQRHADLFVLPSGWEGFPMVLGEAMACGLPIVSADCPTGPREFLAPATIGQTRRPLREAEHGEYGLLLPIPSSNDPGTLACWVDALDGLLDDAGERRRMAAQARARADDFSRERIGPQWVKVIADLLDRSASTSA